MNGLQLSRLFFFEWGLPFLQRSFPQLIEQIAAGTFNGSHTLEADDELSRDHAWGPRFALYLPTESAAHWKTPLEQALNTAAPQTFHGYQLALTWEKHVEVHATDDFYQQEIGWSHPPEDIIDWVQSRAPSEEWVADSSRMREREYHLYMLRHGHIFSDPHGDFSARQKAFWSYPEDIWLLRLWQETFAIWHYGQYNFLDRLVHRQDPLAIALCLGYFADAVMRLCLLLARDYSPYWKWLPFVFRQLPIAAELETPFRLLFETSDRKEQSRSVQEICHRVHCLLIEEQLVKKDAPNPTGHPHPLNVALPYILEHIKEKRIRALFHYWSLD